jgi:Lsr2
MARKVSIVMTDDLDGSDGAETVAFSLDGVAYEIDLSAKNRAKLERALAPFIEASRRVPPGVRRRQRGRSGRSPTGGTAVRTWARSEGLKVARQYKAARGLGGDHRGD